MTGQQRTSPQYSQIPFDKLSDSLTVCLSLLLIQYHKRDRISLFQI